MGRRPILWAGAGAPVIRLPDSGRFIGGEWIPIPAEIRAIYERRPGQRKRPVGSGKMTLCLAATCDRSPWPREQCAILSYDRKISEAGAGSHEIGEKLVGIAPRWWALLASDDLDSGRDMMRFFKKRLARRKITPDNAQDFLEQGLDDYRSVEIDRYVKSQCGLSLRDFALGGKVNLEAGQLRRIRHAIRNGVAPEHQAIFVGWIQHDKTFGAWHIFLLIGDRIIEKQDFAAIGSGCYIAHTMWNIRQKTVFRRLPETLYRIYEAQRMGSAEPSVGTSAQTLILTMTTDGSITMRSLESDSRRDDDYANQLWNRHLGLTDLTGDIKEDGFRFYEFRRKA